jgi:hypothetical protein
MLGDLSGEKRLDASVAYGEFLSLPSKVGTFCVRLRLTDAPPAAIDTDRATSQAIPVTRTSLDELAVEATPTRMRVRSERRNDQAS